MRVGIRYLAAWLRSIRDRRVGDDPDRAVTASPDHEINPRGHSLLGHAAAGVIGGGFQP